MSDELKKFYDTVGTQVKKRELLRGYDGETSPEAQPDIDRPRGRILKHRWAQADDLFWNASETCEKLEAGFYKFDNRPHTGPCLRRITIATDDLIRLPDTATEKVLKEFSTFWGLKNRFTERGFLHKRGILLHGQAGSGKTASLMLMADDIVHNHDGLVCDIDHPQLAAACLAMIRKIEPERRIVAFMEDLDALVERHGENAYLALLDGETQVNNIIYIATTNYPERLDPRFVDRPSRFDTVQWIGMPSDDARRIYLQTKEPSLSEGELDRWVTQTKGFSVAHLRELIILVKCFDHPLAVAIRRLEHMRTRRPNSGDDRPLFGIGRD